MSYDVTATTTNTPPTALLSHTEWIRSLARSLVRDAAAADDLTQDTLLAALRGQPRDPARLRPWLAGIARNLARNEQRKGRRRGDTEADRALETLKDQDPSHFKASTQAATLARAEAHRLLVEHVLSMPEPARDLLLQRYFEGRKPAEIAALQGISPAAVHSGLTRAHGALRKRLEGDGDKQEWLATVGLLLLPVAAKKGAASATAAKAGASATKGFWGTGWAVGIGAFVTVAIAVTVISVIERGGVRHSPSEENHSKSPTAVDAAQPTLPVEVVGVERNDERTAASTGGADESKIDTEPTPDQDAELAMAEPDEVPAVAVAPTHVQLDGRYIDAKGNPIAFAKLGLFRAVDGRPEFWTKSTKARSAGQTTTDADGLFSFPNAEVGAYVVGPIPKEAGTTAWLFPVELKPDAPILLESLQALGDHWIEGQVEGEIRRSRKRLELTAFRNDVAVQATTQCEPDGSFRFGPLAPGTYSLSSIGGKLVNMAIPVTHVEATLAKLQGTGTTAAGGAASPLSIQAVTARRLSGTIKFPTGAQSESKEGTIRIGMYEQEDETGNPTWIAQADVGRDGRYTVRGIDAGLFFTSYESRDGRYFAFSPLVMHDEDQYSASDDLGSGDMRRMFEEFVEQQGFGAAVPAAVAWVRPGSFNDHGALTVTCALGGQMGIGATDGLPPIRFPVGPSGSVRIAMPMKATKVALRDSHDNVLKQWTTSAKEQGQVLILEP